ncbi:MAG: hypothetical protein M4D80_16910 [Myxococcota bacterium]|nr:hypothetical protein [Myxococcota bacterium]
MRAIAVDWRSVKRWCVIATFAMLCWLLFPTAKCSFGAFRDTPLSEQQPTPEAGEEAAEEPGFVSKLGTAIQVCYRKTPLLGQEDWKSYLLFGFAAGALIAGVIAYIEAGRARTFDR